MSGSTRPSSGAVSRQPWSPEQAPKGVTCPACGLANEAGARVCRNCGLPIASANDPVRGVAPGRVVMPGAQRSGVSAVVGLALVLGLLLVGGTLAVSGGGILNAGGRLGVDAAESGAPVAQANGDDGQVIQTGSTQDQDAAAAPVAASGTSFDFTCDADGITDLSRRRWDLDRFLAGSRPAGGYDQITFEMTPIGKKKVKKGTNVYLERMGPDEARERYGAPAKIQGKNALVVTFDGPVGIDNNQSLDSLLLARQNVDQMRNIQMFDGTDGKVHLIVGLRSDSCARLEAKGWAKKSKSRSASILLQIEREEA